MALQQKRDTGHAGDGALDVSWSSGKWSADRLIQLSDERRSSRTLKLVGILYIGNH